MIQDLLSENKNRVFPFKEDSNIGKLPPWVLLDIRLVDAYCKEDASSAHLKCVGFTVSDEVLTLKFTYSVGETKTEFSIPVKVGSDIGIGTVEITGSMSCKFAIYGGGSEYTLDLPDGEYDVDAEILKSRLIVLGDNRKVFSFGGATGVIHVVDGHNTFAKIVDGAIEISIGNNYGLGSDCTIEDDENVFNCKKALMFINGQHADSSGNINITGDGKISVQTGKMTVVDGKMVPAISLKASSLLERML